MLRYIYIPALILLLIPCVLFAQEKVELRHADQLSGRIEDGKSIREVSGNVHFIQGNINVYCNSATQYVDENRVVLVGDVRILQDTLSIFTSRGTYNGNERVATGEGGVTLRDPNATLRANRGTYTFNDGKAVFTGNVIIVNPGYQITSSTLTYMRFSEDSFARGDVTVTTDSAVIKAESIDFFKRQGKTVAFENASINSDSTLITADTLTNFDFEDKSFANGNVTIVNLKNNATVKGNSAENYERNNYSKISGNVRSMQIETENNKTDTTFIYCNFMEAFRNPPETYTATENVEIIRGEFSAKCGYAVYYRDDETAALSINPIVWQSNSQMTGDSIFAELPGERLQAIYVKKLVGLEGSRFSFLITQNEEPGFNDRYDQVSGTDITMRFENDKIKQVDVTENANSIYFLYENNLANGLNKAEGDNMFIYFDDDEKVSRIRIDVNPVGQYVPEVRLIEVGLTLPGFNFRTDRPERRLPF
jgi:lipopolysaccharide export system protein LptA